MYNGSVACAGDNRWGQLGTGKAGGTATSFTQANALAGVNAISVGVGYKFTCVLANPSEGNKVYCLGRSAEGQLGNGKNEDSVVPGRVAGLKQSPPIAQLVVADFNACVLYAGPGNHSSVQC